MNTLEKVLVNRAQNGTYHKEELIEITKKLWITGDISETDPSSFRASLHPGIPVSQISA